MTITPSLIRAEYLEFDTLSDEQLQLIIDDVSFTVTQNRWGQMRDRGIRALTAHELAIKYHHQLKLGTVLKALQTGQPIDSYLLGSQDYYELTPYGKKYWQLLCQLPVIGMMVI